MPVIPLVINELRGDYHLGYALFWYFEEDGDIGGTLGDGNDRYTDADLEKQKNREDWETVIAHLVAEKSPHVQRAKNYGFYWESEKDAKHALKLIKAAWKQDMKVPWPAWALEAVAHGWKPPKTWKP